MQAQAQDAGAAPAAPGTLHERMEHAIDARSAVLPPVALQRRQQLAAAAQRMLVDILKTMFGKGDDLGPRRAEHPPLTEHEISRLEARSPSRLLEHWCPVTI